MPSGLVITLLPVPVSATATKRDNSGAHVTERQSLSAADVLAVQVIPSGLVITLLPVPLTATATKRDNSGAHVTDIQVLIAADVLAVQLLTAASALARLARVRAFSAAIFTPFTFPFPVPKSTDKLDDAILPTQGPHKVF
jgi:hypothetical protein